MSTLLSAPALSLSHRFLVALVLCVRRFVNRSVANILESRERQAMRYMLRKLGERGRGPC
jgi:hypothetical protein